MKALTAFFLFLALCPRPASARPLTLGVIGDLNGTECQPLYPANSLRAFDKLLGGHSLDLLLSTGDAVHGECLRYQGKAPYEGVVRAMWEEFDQRFARRAHEGEGVSLVLAPGNHDAPFLSAGSRETFRIENAEFVRYWQGVRPHLGVKPLELPEVKDNYPYYWAYTFEGVLFVVLQSTRTGSLSNGEEQKRWLRELLRSPAARAARARIAYGHVPAYAVLDPSVGAKYQEIMAKEQVGEPGSLMDLLLDHGVDLLVVGHSHAPYPGELRRASDGRALNILSMPCAHAPRKLYSKTAVAPRGYAVVQLSQENKISLSVHDWSTGQALPLSYFPPSIPLKNAKATYRRIGR